MAYSTPEDIANRALQHCGVPPSNRIASLTEGSKNAKECALAYHKVRQAELRRNVWRFSIRHAVLRAIDTTSRIYTPPTWVAATAYAVGDIVAYTDPIDGSVGYWLSVGVDLPQNSNTGNTPGRSARWANYFGPVVAAPYDSTISYFAGDIIYVGDLSSAWISLKNGNDDGLEEGASWHELAASVSTHLSAVNLIYPIGSGPSSQSTTRNVFRLPNGYLREAPQDPKAGSVSFLGAATGLEYTDWTYEGNYIVSSETGPIVYRFAADWTDVTTMDPLFCEGLAARLAYEICESITQSAAKIQAITAEYQKAITDARLVNGIETGPVEPPVDDWIACRA